MMTTGTVLLLTWFIRKGNMQTGSDDRPVSTKPGGREGRSDPSLLSNLVGTGT
jgi:hypothetical protein